MFTSGSPNQGQLQIGIALVLEDRFSNQAREASSQIRRLHQDAKNVTNANLNAVAKMSAATSVGSAMVLNGMYQAVLQGAKFIDTMTFVRAIAKDTGTDFELLSKRAKTLGKDTMFTSQDIGSAMQYMAMAGQGTTEIFNNITAAADLANATMSELGGKGGAADIMTNIMKMFMIPSSELNSTRVADVLTRAVTRSNTNLYDLGEAIKYAGTTTTNLGATLEQTAAAIGVMGDAGIQGSMAGTALANAYRYLSKSIGDPNFKGGKALKKLGLGREDFLDANGQLIDLGLAMQKIAQASSGLGSLDQYNLLVSILGVRGERSGSTMIRAFQNYQNLLKELNNNSQGAAADVRTQRMASLAGAIETVQSTWENLQTSFTEALGPTLIPYLRAGGKILENIQAIFESPVGKFVAALMAGSATFITIAATTTALKASWRLLFNDSTVSLKNMFAVMNQGWREGTISASQYLAMQQAIIAQGKAGLVGAAGKKAFNNTAWAMMATQNPGKYYGGYMAKQDKRGNWRYYQQNPTGGVTRVSGASVAQATSKMNTKQILGVGAGLTGVGVGGAIGKLGFGATMRGIGGFLGGPWGMLAMTLITFLPTIIDAIRGNTDSQNDNTNQLRKLTPEEQRQRNIEAANLTPEERGVLYTKAMADYAKMMEVYINKMNQQQTQNTPGNVIIYIDGQEVINKALNQYQFDQIINVGGR